MALLHIKPALLLISHLIKTITAILRNLHSVYVQLLYIVVCFLLSIVQVFGALIINFWYI